MVLVLAAIICYGFFIEAKLISVSHIWIKMPELERLLGDKVIVHLSDLHISKVSRLENQILHILNKLNPDMLFLTGDYVKWKGDYTPALHFLSRLNAKDGIWAVMGDYDYSDSKQSCIFCHELQSNAMTRLHKVHFLRNTVTSLELPGGKLQIAGIDPAESGFSSSSKAVSEQLTIDYSIILTHSPLSFDYIPKDKRTLILAGDTHGGQVPLPTWLFRLLGYKKNSRYEQGLFEDGKKKMYVTRGIGTSHIPIRLFRPPEIAVLHFTH